MNDKLKMLFGIQNNLQEKIGFHIEQMDCYRRQRYIEKMFIGMVTELSEAIEETPWKKPWKKSVVHNEEKFKQELIDAWHFLINLSIASGMDADELFKRYTEKHDINEKRQEDGY